MEPKTAWFIIIARENSPSVIVGPYEDEEDAIDKMTNSLFIDGLCEEDSIDATVVELPVLELNPLVLAIDYVVPPDEGENVFHGFSQESVS